MSASEQQRAEWLDPAFWDRFERLEKRHRALQSEHELARRRLESVADAEALRGAWERYCVVIAELDQTAAEFAALHK